MKRRKSVVPAIPPFLDPPNRVAPPAVVAEPAAVAEVSAENIAAVISAATNRLHLGVQATGSVDAPADERRSRIHRRVRRSVAVVTAVGSGLVGVSAAQAYFTSTGSGSGSASTGTVLPVSASGAVVSNLLPDGTTHNVTLTVTNPNAFPVTLKSVTGNGAITADAAHLPGCAPTDVSFTDQTGLNVSIPSGGPTPVTLSGAAAMGTNSATGCQGATFTIPVTISVQKP